MKTEDAFYYIGSIERGVDERFIKHVLEKRHSISEGTEEKSPAEKVPRTALLILVTFGGNPDAAYKISRCFQENYDHFTVIVPSVCKSAGTLIAVGAEKLVFFPCGELGPLDVQISKADNIGRQESGLNIDEAFRTIEKRTTEMFHRMVGEIIAASGGVVTFQTASSVASSFSSSLYCEVLKKVDPEEVGSRTRAMRIGEEYCERLNMKFENLNTGSLQTLSRTYPSHSFVIDMLEAKNFFKRVHEHTKHEEALVKRVEEKYFWLGSSEPCFGDVPDSDENDSVSELGNDTSTKELAP